MEQWGYPLRKLTKILLNLIMIFMLTIGSTNASSTYTPHFTYFTVDNQAQTITNLGLPSSVTLGGVQPTIPNAHQWLSGISSSGIPILSQPSFGDITGSIGYNQIPDMSGVNYTALNGTTPRPLSTHLGDILNIKDFGAKGDCSTDDSAAFNAMAAFIQTTTGYSALRTIVLAPNTCYFVRSSINFTGFTGYRVNVQGNGSVIVGNVGATHAIISAMNSNINVHDLRIITQGNVLYGIQIGNTGITLGDQPAYFDNVHVIGTFVNAAMLDRAAEGSLFIHLELVNQLAGGYASIMDGMAHWAIDTTYVADSLAPDTQMSFNENTFIDSVFSNSATTGFSPDIWMANFGRHVYIDSYTEVSSASPAVVLYSKFSNSTNMLYWDVHSEIGPSSEFFFTGTYATPSMFGLHVRNHLDQTATNSSFFAIDGTSSVTSVSLPDLKMEIADVYYSGVTAFDQPAKYSGTATISLPTAKSSFWNPVAGNFQGCNSLNGTFSCIASTPVATVATLPICITALSGIKYTVTDALTPTYNSALTAGGTGASARIPVVCNGTSWTAH